MLRRDGNALGFRLRSRVDLQKKGGGKKGEHSQIVGMEGLSILRSSRLACFVIGEMPR